MHVVIVPYVVIVGGETRYFVSVVWLGGVVCKVVLRCSQHTTCCRKTCLLAPQSQHGGAESVSCRAFSMLFSLSLIKNMMPVMMMTPKPLLRVVPHTALCARTAAAHVVIRARSTLPTEPETPTMPSGDDFPSMDVFVPGGPTERPSEIPQPDLVPGALFMPRKNEATCCTRPRNSADANRRARGAPAPRASRHDSKARD